MTKLKLKRPLVVLDLETTGVSVVKDRIIQIACTKIDPKGKTEVKSMYINPGMPIPKESTEVHGIDDEFVKDKPLFSRLAKGILAFIEGCDVGGYNSDQFDFPLLSAEFERVGISWPPQDIVLLDVMKIESMVNPRTLVAVYERYMNDGFPDAHNASADVEATIDVLFKQIEVHDLPIDVEALQALCAGDKERVDIAGKLYRKDGVVYYGFGQDTKGVPVKDNPGFGRWMLRGDFSNDTKRWVESLI